MKKTLNTDGGIKETFHYDNHDGKTYISQSQDVTPFLKQAHDARAARGEHSSYKSEVFNKKASIPETVALKWCRDKKIPYANFLNDTKVLRQFINDPDNKCFLHIPGKV